MYLFTCAHHFFTCTCTCTCTCTLFFSLLNRSMQKINPIASSQKLSQAPTTKASPSQQGIIGICVICLREDQKLMRCSRCREISYCGPQCQRSHWKFHKVRCGPTKKPLGKGQLAMRPTDLGMCGKTGLLSFGNTCFLNSAIQCLSGAEDFVRYFISDKYKREINKTNVLGHAGQVAETYANLLKQLWFGNESVVVPKQLVQTVAKIWTQFNGIGAFQHQVLEKIMCLKISFALRPLHAR